MLALAEELQNIRLASKRAGISRSHFCEIKQAFEKYGADGLAPRNRRKLRMPNQTLPELEQKILEMTERYPTFSFLRISQQLRLVGIGVSPSAVRYVWQRHGLTLRYQRLLWLEQKTAARGGVLTESQLRLLRPSADGQAHRSRAACRGPRARLPAFSGHLLRGHHQRRGQGLHAVGGRRPLLAGLREALPLQAPHDGGGRAPRRLTGCPSTRSMRSRSNAS